MSILQYFSDTLFPVFCLSCNTEGEWVCASCKKDIQRAGVFRCPICHAQTGGGTCCKACHTHSSLHAHIAVSVYREGDMLSRCIEAFKYNGASDSIRVFDEMIAGFVAEHSEIFSSLDVIAPVPLYPIRERDRGFNQASLLAQSLGRHLHKPVVNLLRRHKETRQQAKLSKKERQQNVADAFVYSSDGIPYSVLLVDDVYTTGSTLQACAKALKDGGVQKVIGFSIARGE